MDANTRKAPWVRNADGMVSGSDTPAKAEQPVKSVTLWATVGAALLGILDKILWFRKNRVEDRGYADSVRQKADEEARQRHREIVTEASTGDPGAMERLRREAAE